MAVSWLSVILCAGDKDNFSIQSPGIRKDYFDFIYPGWAHLVFFKGRGSRLELKKLLILQLFF